ncbi:MAG: hypothetical protein ABIO70_02745 [Pseudomonadota bacterium]
MPRALLTLSLACALMLAGCISKHAPIQAAHPATVAVAASLAVLDDTAIQPVPDGLSSVIGGLLAARNLTARPLDPASYVAPFATRRTSQHRLTLVAEQAQGAEFLLLVETTVAFYSQMNGRFRWTVEVEATISPSGDLTQAFSAHFQVPVFLDHVHEKEVEALTAATPMIERRLGALLDAYLGGL